MRLCADGRPAEWHEDAARLAAYLDILVGPETLKHDVKTVRLGQADFSCSCNNESAAQITWWHNNGSC